MPLCVRFNFLRPLANLGMSWPTAIWRGFSLVAVREPAMGGVCNAGRVENIEHRQIGNPCRWPTRARTVAGYRLPYQTA